MNDPTFCDLVCDAFNCLPDDFNETVFWLCLFPHAIFLARLLWRVHRNYFSQDFVLLESLKPLTSIADVRAELNYFNYRHPQRGFLRGYLKVRISGRRLMTLADKLFVNTG